MRSPVTKAKLVLDDDMAFDGDAFGSLRAVGGEVVFNTGMAGYVESYAGQILVLDVSGGRELRRTGAAREGEAHFALRVGPNPLLRASSSSTTSKNAAITLRREPSVNGCWRRTYPH